MERVISKSARSELMSMGSTWTIPVKMSQSYISLDGIYDKNNQLLNIDLPHTWTEANVFYIQFGVDSYEGYAKYSWLEYDDVDESTCDNTGQVVVNVNACDSNDSSNVSNKLITSDTSIKVGNLSDKLIKLEYCLYTASKTQTGFIYITNDINGIITDEYKHSTDGEYFPIAMVASKNDYIYLNINNVSEEYNLRYIITKL